MWKTEEPALMDVQKFKYWRKTLRYTQPQAGRELGVERSTIQNWERGCTPIPISIELACQVLTRRWRQRAEYGPVTLVYADERFWPEPDCPTRAITLRCELCDNNEIAIRRAVQLRLHPSFRNPVIMESDGGIIWNAPDLLRECDKRRKREMLHR